MRIYLNNYEYYIHMECISSYKNELIIVNEYVEYKMIEYVNKKEHKI